jgi:hypothetical protein
VKRLLLITTALALLALPAVARADTTATPAEYLAAASQVTVTDAGTIPADASTSGQAEDITCGVCSGSGPAPGEGTAAIPKTTPKHNRSDEAWSTVWWTLKGTNDWMMWYTTEKYWESYNVKRVAHRVTYAAMLDHQGYVNKAWALLGWRYDSDACLAWTLMTWNGHANGEHYSKYVGHFECVPLRVGGCIATRDARACIAAHYNGSYSTAGSGG